MGIQSTRNITRKEIITRISFINTLACSKDYRELEQSTYELESDIQDFIDNYNNINIADLDKWTDKMLEDQIDKPFFRFSMFDNYLIENN